MKPKQELKDEELYSFSGCNHHFVRDENYSKRRAWFECILCGKRSLGYRQKNRLK